VCYVSDPNGATDLNITNDESTYSFALFGNGTLPVSEGFEVPVQTSVNWSPLPVQAGSDWKFTTQSFSGGAQSMMVDNLNNVPNNTSILQGLNNYNFATVSNPYFHFKVAYQQKSAANNDKLSLEISNDCGKTWWTKWSKQGAALATTNVFSSAAFAPAASDYAEYSIPGVISHNTAFRWVFVSDPTAPGNNIFLDDINLGERQYVGIDENSAPANSFDLYPNPGNGATTVKFALSKPASVEINVSDISGRKVIGLTQAQYSAGEQLISINKDSSLSPGVYLVTVSTDGLRSSRKLVIN
jgi:type IX secretion system substrate protein